MINPIDNMTHKEIIDEITLTLEEEDIDGVPAEMIEAGFANFLEDLGE